MDFLSMNVIYPEHLLLNLQHDLKKWTSLGFTANLHTKMRLKGHSYRWKYAQLKSRITEPGSLTQNQEWLF